MALQIAYPILKTLAGAALKSQTVDYSPNIAFSISLSNTRSFAVSALSEASEEKKKKITNMSVCHSLSTDLIKSGSTCFEQTLSI